MSDMEKKSTDFSELIIARSTFPQYILPTINKPEFGTSTMVTSKVVDPNVFVGKKLDADSVTKVMETAILNGRKDLREISAGGKSIEKFDGIESKIFRKEINSIADISPLVKIFIMKKNGKEEMIEIKMKLPNIIEVELPKKIIYMGVPFKENMFFCAQIVNSGIRLHFTYHNGKEITKEFFYDTQVIDRLTFHV